MGYHCCRTQTDMMIAFQFVLLLAFGAAVTTAEEELKELEEEHGHGKRNIDMEAAEADGLTLEEFDRLEMEGREMEGLGEQNEDLWEGDIVRSPGFRNANAAQNTWPGNVVPYYFDRSVDSSSRSKINNALALMNRLVNQRGDCLKIRPYQRGDRAAIKVIKGRGCYSSVGRTRGSSQDLSIGYGCTSTGTIQHEFMHALGFWHEQSRDDRDKYVTINWNNIAEKNRHNFKSYRTANQGFGYDYGSVMHYGAYAFSTNRKPTIVTKGGQRIGQRSGVSNQDVAEIRRLYGC